MMRFNERSHPRTHAHVLVDFDGTIAVDDTTDLLLEEFADPAWQQVEEEWRVGRIGSRECMSRQIALVRATPEELRDFCAGIDIDPGFASFVRACDQMDLPLTVVSDGLDFNVQTVLDRAGFDLSIRANQLTYLGNRQWTLSFPFSHAGCATLAGTCKCQVAKDDSRDVTILVGDGRSDFCVARRVDFVLAKAALIEHCQNAGIAHVPFQSFSDARDQLVAWLSRAGLRAEEPLRSGE